MQIIGRRTPNVPEYINKKSGLKAGFFYKNDKEHYTSRFGDPPGALVSMNPPTRLDVGSAHQGIEESDRLQIRIFHIHPQTMRRLPIMVGFPQAGPGSDLTQPLCSAGGWCCRRAVSAHHPFQGLP